MNEEEIKVCDTCVNGNINKNVKKKEKKGCIINE